MSASVKNPSEGQQAPLGMEGSGPGHRWAKAKAGMKRREGSMFSIVVDLIELDL